VAVVVVEEKTETGIERDITSKIPRYLGWHV